MSEPSHKTVSVEELMGRPISFFRRIEAKKPSRQTTVREFLRVVRGEEHSMSVAAIRRMLAEKGKVAANKVKCALPAVTFAGVFGYRSKLGLDRHSGLLPLDFDNLADGLAAARETLIADPHVVAVFVSPSGNGLKALLACDAVDDETHERAFLAAQSHFERLGLSADPSGKDVCRLCFVSYDPTAWSREEEERVMILSTPYTIYTPTPSTRSTPSTPSTPSTRHAEIRERRLQRKELAASFDSNPVLARIFRNYVEHRPALPGERNSTITKLVPALYSVVSEPVILRFSMAWYAMNRAIFKDSREDHERETVAMLKCRARSYERELDPGTLSVYETFDGERDQAAFRICRDLAARSDNRTFFLSCDELGGRIECDSRQAHRILSGFSADGLIERIKLGVARARGVKGQATYWKWLLT